MGNPKHLHNLNFIYPSDHHRENHYWNLSVDDHLWGSNVENYLNKMYVQAKIYIRFRMCHVQIQNSNESEIELCLFKSFNNSLNWITATFI